jgi:hypothetical protein
MMTTDEAKRLSLIDDPHEARLYESAINAVAADGDEELADAIEALIEALENYTLHSPTRTAVDRFHEQKQA